MGTRDKEQDRPVTDTEFARRVTGGLSDADHERFIKYYAKLKPDERIKVHAIQTKLSQKKRDRMYDRAHAGSFYYGTFLSAIREYMRLQSRSAESSRMGPKEAAERDCVQEVKRKAKLPRKSSVALELVEKRFDKIKELRDKGVSWRTIAEQLSKGKKGTVISHASLISNFKKVAYERGL